MLKLLRQVLCLGLLFGLAGNGIANASPCLLMEDRVPAAMTDMADCPMAAACPDCGLKERAGDKPAKRASGCMAMTACAAMLAMEMPAEAADFSQRTGTAYFRSAVLSLAGRELAPEPNPPTILG